MTTSFLPAQAEADLRDRLAAVRRRLADAAAASGRSPDEVRLVAISKTHPAEYVAALALAWGPGTPVFGENYVQEALAKQDAVAALLAQNTDCAGASLATSVDASTSAAPPCPPAIEWHCTGHIQSRKAPDIVGRFSLIHTLDSEKLARNLHKIITTQGLPVQQVLIQVNVGREPQKSGVLPEDAEKLIDALRDLPGLSIEGLMCIPPLEGGAEDSRPHFAALRRLRDALRRSSGLALPHLSMGMSHDCVVAVNEGATLVRVGTDIFGSRPPK